MCESVYVCAPMHICKCTVMCVYVCWEIFKKKISYRTKQDRNNSGLILNEKLLFSSFSLLIIIIIIIIVLVDLQHQLTFNIDS